MKQYLDQQQTTKLLELGFDKPKTCLGVGTKEEAGDLELGYIWAYSIGELIKMLPENVAKENEMPSTLNISLMNGEWCVQYADFLGTDFEFCNTELIDALFDMIVKLKEQGVI